MDPAFDSARTAGYRDVVVNLQLVGEVAQRLGVARHVSELQLILAPILELRVRRIVPPCLCLPVLKVEKSPPWEAKMHPTRLLRPTRALSICASNGQIE